ncbi:DUF1553 domain-containing protein [Anseongella ginsenosidimutans]|nr:DUF1553 domain-containing protein [Anseongella ginsenosidimutans]
MIAATATSLLLINCNRSEPEGITGSGKLPDKVDFNFHVKPVLSDRCFACHGPDDNAREADLRLDLEENAYAALKDMPEAHAIVPGKPEESMVYLRITSDDPDLKMPPPSSNLKLSEYEIKLIGKWIKQGAEYEKHWAFLPPEKPALPEVSREDWPRNDIDRFVLSKMDLVGLEPNEPADKEHLLRRVSVDLTGLPPDLEMMDAFLADDSPQAYEKIIDQLLASPAYGEKMALHWLDVGRYADSYGYQDDDRRTQWPWRDWVIHAFNENMPYDQFLLWQLAGDMLPEANKEQILATAFNRNHKYTEEGGVIEEEYRVTYNIDKTNTFSKGILGITMECAQCHDHKYDPFSQQDYYEMYAFFNNTPEKGLEGLVGSEPAKTPILYINDEDVKGILDFVNKPDTGRMMVSVMEELDTLRKTYILNRGLYDSPGKRVFAATPEAILPLDTTRYPRNRLGLAKWTISKENPLTARVFVNQVWNKIFGRGIVESTGDFGAQGKLPSHPELLDYLAVSFMEHDWDIKWLVKELVTSATYRQSAKISEKKLYTDPDNIYLARASRLRLPAELIRDHLLASSGLLVKQLGGPSFKGYQPDGIWEVTSSGRGTLARYVQDHGQDLYRRGIYGFIKLTVPPPNMLIFDASNRDQCEVERQRTNTPLQALVMMNDPAVLEAARVLSGTLLSQQELAPQERITRAFRRILCRTPKEKELELLMEFYKQELERYGKEPEKAKAFLQAGEYPHRRGLDAVQHAALMSLVHGIYNLEEAITRS